jgi:hypothetical protein
MNKLNKIITGAALTTLLAGQAVAGTLGATSTDNSIVSLEVVDRVQITNVDNIALGAYGGTGTLTGATQYCVFRNGADNYTVKLTTDTGAYQVSSASTLENISFSVNVDSDADASNGQPLAYNTASIGMAGSAQTNCGGLDNGAIEVNFAQADLLAVSSGNDYTATMTILVEPI